MIQLLKYDRFKLFDHHLFLKVLLKFYLKMIYKFPFVFYQIDDNGDLKLADLTKYVKEELLIGAEWQKAMADKTIAKCAEEAREEASKPRTNPNACNPSAIKFGHCVWREVQFACPADKIQDMQKCQKLRERLVKKDQTLFLAEQQAVDAQ